MNPKLIAPLVLILLALLAIANLIPESSHVFDEIGQFLRDHFEKG